MTATSRHFDLLRRTVVTEKATLLSQYNSLMFEVAMDASKPEIRAAVESVFGVKVKRVNTSIRKGKNTRFRGRPGRRRDRKHAVVTLAEGHSIDFSSRSL